MFLARLFEKNKELNKINVGKYTFEDFFNLWVEQLFERVMRLFVWENTGDVEPKEIEQILLLNGVCGVTDKYKGVLSVFNGYLCGEPTQYYDEYKAFSVHSPVYSNILEIGKSVVLIDNTAIRNSVYPLIVRYATMLAHTELTLVGVMVNLRECGSIPVAGTNTELESLKAYRKSLFNGEILPIKDPAFSAVKFVETNSGAKVNIKDIIETRQNLLDSFYNDIGVKTGYSKKGNMIQEEVEANDSMLLLNISDMLDSRKKGAERVNAMYGTNWSVKLAEGLEINRKGSEENV